MGPELRMAEDSRLLPACTLEDIIFQNSNTQVWLVSDDQHSLGVAKTAISPLGAERLAQEAHAYRELGPHKRLLEMRASDNSALLLEPMLGTLSHWRARPYTNSMLTRMAIDVLDALAYMHVKGMVHRDVRPSNIFWRTKTHPLHASRGEGSQYAAIRARRDAQVEENSIVFKLGDLGLARSIGGEADPEGVAYGSVRYMSPEQARGMRLDGKSDVFSLGLTLYELFTGEFAYGKGKDSSQEVAIAMEASVGRVPYVVERNRPTRASIEPSEHRHGLLLREMIRRCTVEDPDERPSAYELARWVERERAAICATAPAAYGMLWPRGANLQYSKPTTAHALPEGYGIPQGRRPLPSLASVVNGLLPPRGTA